MGDYIYVIVVSCVVFFCGLVPTLITLWLNERVKGSVRSFFDLRLEEIKKEHSKELSQFQTELNHLKSKENIKFAKLHEKRFEVLAEIYKHINYLVVALQNSIIPLKTSEKNVSFEENEKKLLNDYRLVMFGFYEYFAINKIYLSVNIADLIDNLVMQSNIIVSENVKNKGQGGMEVYNKLKEIVIPIKNEIEIEFRKVLGDDNR